MQKKGFRAGFTLVELSISIAFIALLSIAIALITTNLIAAYRRGMTLKQVNTVGTDLVNDIRSAISGSSAKGIKELCATVYKDSGQGSNRQNCENDGAYEFVNVVRIVDTVPVFGAFCSGMYSYIWNSGYFYDDSEYQIPSVNNSPASFTYKDGGVNKFRLLKVLDVNREVCINANGDSYGADENLTEFRIGSSLAEEPVELLDSNNNLALYNLEVARPAQDDLTKNIFYAGSFVLGTTQDGINIKASGSYCEASNDYCSINKFNFAMQANGE